MDPSETTFASGKGVRIAIGQDSWRPTQPGFFRLFFLVKDDFQGQSRLTRIQRSARRQNFVAYVMEGRLLQEARCQALEICHQKEQLI